MEKMKKIIKLTLLLFLVLFCALLLFRVCIYDHYPDEATDLRFTDSLTAYYNRVGEDGFHAYTQDIRFPYDDEDEGNFFSNSLIVIPDAGHLQITVRYNSLNDDLLKKIRDVYKLGASPDMDTLDLRFTLQDNLFFATEGTGGHEYPLEASKETEFLFYRYRTLSFTGVDMTDVQWLRVAVYYGEEAEPFAYLAIYEKQVTLQNGETVDYDLEEYSLSSTERP